MNEDKIKNIRQHGKQAKGQKDLLNHLQGRRLTMQQAINAHCYDCVGFYADGKVDCQMTKCPLHNFMPYNEKRAKRTTSRTASDAHMEKMRSARRK